MTEPTTALTARQVAVLTGSGDAVWFVAARSDATDDALDRYLGHGAVRFRAFSDDYPVWLVAVPECNATYNRERLMSGSWSVSKAHASMHGATIDAAEIAEIAGALR